MREHWGTREQQPHFATWTVVREPGVLTIARPMHGIVKSLGWIEWLATLPLALAASMGPARFLFLGLPIAAALLGVGVLLKPELRQSISFDLIADRVRVRDRVSRTQRDLCRVTEIAHLECRLIPFEVHQTGIMWIIQIVEGTHTDYKYELWVVLINGSRHKLMTGGEGDREIGLLADVIAGHSGVPVETVVGSAQRRGS
jgi:hypothetical protein